jgi:hypothetical protein
MIEPITMMAMVAWSVLGIAVLVAHLPVGTCAECEHCRRKRLLEEYERAHRGTDDLREFNGLGRCPRCGKHHQLGDHC